MSIVISTTNRGLAAAWESGGGLTSGGSATVVAGSKGERLTAIFQPRGGHLACGQHALFQVEAGCHLVKVSVRHGVREQGSISRIVSTTVARKESGWTATAEVEEVNTFSRGEWRKPLDPIFLGAVEAAFEKASSYHCRSAYWVADGRPDPTPAEVQAQIDARQARERAAVIEQQAAARAWEADMARSEALRVEAVEAEKAKIASIGMVAWTRRGAWSNAGDAWVVRPDGTFVEADEIDCPRPRYPDEGTRTWRAIEPTDLAIRWSKPDTGSAHEFEVVARPATLTTAQEEAVKRIEGEIAARWDGQKSMSGRNTSPPVGQGWGLTTPKPESKPTPPPVTEPIVAAPTTPPGPFDLSKLFGGQAKVIKRK